MVLGSISIKTPGLGSCRLQQLRRPWDLGWVFFMLLPQPDPWCSRSLGFHSWSLWSNKISLAQVLKRSQGCVRPNTWVYPCLGWCSFIASSSLVLQTSKLVKLVGFPQCLVHLAIINSKSNSDQNWTFFELKGWDLNEDGVTLFT